MATPLDKISNVQREKARGIRLLVLDVDGVLTDGHFSLDEDGRETKTFNTQDGFGLRQLLDSGIQIAIITGRNSGAVTHRMAELGITHVFQACRDKQAVIRELMDSLNVESSETAAVGDDTPDLKMFAETGLRIAVSNATQPLIAAADLITTRPGGHGAVREIADFLLATRNASRS